LLRRTSLYAAIISICLLVDSLPLRGYPGGTQESVPRQRIEKAAEAEFRRGALFPRHPAAELESHLPPAVALMVMFINCRSPRR